MLVLITILQLLIYFADSANILGIICLPLVSHHLPYNALWRELSLRGHNVTTITSFPIDDKKLVNLTEINVKDSIIDDEQTVYKLMDELTKDTWFNMKNKEIIYYILSKIQIGILKSEGVQKLFKSNATFDLVISEVHFPAVLSLVTRFDCPWIALCPMDAPVFFHEIMGNPTNPALFPDFNMPISNLESLTFFDRLLSFFAKYVQIYYVLEEIIDEADEISRKYLGNFSAQRDVHYNPSLAFINAHPLTHEIRPLNPNTIELGTGLHLHPPKDLPNDIQKFLDEAKEGAIYFSLGSTINDQLPNIRNIYNIALEALSNNGYKVLMRMTSNPFKIPSNVKTSKWLPQQDILRHPNVKLFITQGGIQSIQEALYNGIPVIAIPCFGDQHYNANKLDKMKYGIKLDKNGLTVNIFKTAVKEVIENPRYRRRAKELMQIFRDEDVPALQKAVYWTEYVIKYKGAKHLKSPATNMPFWKFYQIDVISFIIFILCVLILILSASTIAVLYTLKVLFKKLLSKFCGKIKIKST